MTLEQEEELKLLESILNNQIKACVKLETYIIPTYNSTFNAKSEQSQSISQDRRRDILLLL